MLLIKRRSKNIFFFLKFVKVTEKERKVNKQLKRKKELDKFF